MYTLRYTQVGDVHPAVLTVVRGTPCCTNGGERYTLVYTPVGRVHPGIYTCG